LQALHSRVYRWKFSILLTVCTIVSAPISAGACKTFLFGRKTWLTSLSSLRRVQSQAFRPGFSSRSRCRYACTPPHPKKREDSATLRATSGCVRWQIRHHRPHRCFDQETRCVSIASRFDDQHCAAICLIFLLAPSVFSDCKTPTLVSCLSPCISATERVCACILRGNTPIEWWIFENVASQTPACFDFAHLVRKQWSFHRCWSYCKLDSTSNLKGSSTQLIILFQYHRSIF
jgi:hypothetical protein